MGDYDIGYKRLFSEPVMVRDLLEHFVREDWVAALDFSTLERANQDLVTPDGRERRCDTVWRVRFQGEWKKGMGWRLGWEDPTDRSEPSDQRLMRQ